VTAAAVRPTRPLIRRRGWPKDLPCLRCNRIRKATHAGDREHERCPPEGVEGEHGSLKLT
jgi:hypothetical protein